MVVIHFKITTGFYRPKRNIIFHTIKIEKVKNVIFLIINFYILYWACKVFWDLILSYFRRER